MTKPHKRKTNEERYKEKVTLRARPKLVGKIVKGKQVGNENIKPK